jgi:hypothetical protein
MLLLESNVQPRCPWMQYLLRIWVIIVTFFYWHRPNLEIKASGELFLSGYRF